jgi:large subunit ribosomal protein L28
MSRVCQLTKKRRNIANKVSHSNIKTKKQQDVNIQKKRIWYPEENRYVQLRLSTSAIRTLKKKGLAQFAKEVGLDLSKH